MSRRQFTATPAAGCSAQQGRDHVWRAARRESADLVSYRDGYPGGADVGATVALGYCTECGVPLLAVGPYGSEFKALPVWLELSAGFIDAIDDDADPQGPDVEGKAGDEGIAEQDTSKALAWVRQLMSQLTEEVARLASEQPAVNLGAYRVSLLPATTRSAVE
jgi:hypothetical protein